MGQPADGARHRGTDKPGDTRRTANQSGHPLLENIGNTDGVKHPGRREEADEMTKEHGQDSHEEQDEAPDQLLASQDLD
ncbi:MAG: hypothetical protein AAGF30_02090 [Pseudomonadota bacterium]